MEKDNKRTEGDNTDKKLHISDVRCSKSYLILLDELWHKKNWRFFQNIK